MLSYQNRKMIVVTNKRTCKHQVSYKQQSRPRAFEY